jgi:hypothetical protein
VASRQRSEARDAFAQSFQLAAAVSAALAMATAVVALVLLREVRSTAQAGTSG